MIKRFEVKNPDLLLKLLLFCWWIINIIQATFTELANDEAYYWIFAQNLDWGYFDHPPMTALMVWLGNFLGGSLGARFLFTVFQPLYIYIIWLLARPITVAGDTLKNGKNNRNALLFFLIAASMPILMLYGFIAVPDGPLMLFTALFLYCFKYFATKNRWIDATLLGICMAALVYSKYHAALVIFFAFTANYKLFKNPKTYVSGLIALMLIFPHLAWQYSHDWISFRYHLIERNSSFNFSNIIEYILNFIAVFNPLFFPLYLAGLRKCGFMKHAPEYRALYAITVGFTVFFLFSCLRGHVQPQWIIPVSFGLTVILFNFVRNSVKLSRFIFVTGIVSISLFTLLRVEMIFNPLNLKMEIFNNKRSHEQIAEITKGKPVIFRGNYTFASKYIYYTGNEAYSQASINYRTSQWEYIDNDSDFAGRDIVLEVANDQADSTVTLANGRNFSWKTINDFRPVRKVNIKIASGNFPEPVRRNDKISLELLFENPYNYDITVSPAELPLIMVLGYYEMFEELILDDASFVIPANGKISKTIHLTVPQIPERKNYIAGFALRYSKMDYWFNSKQYKINLINR